MGSVSLKIGDGTARFRRATLWSSALHLLMLASVLATNLFAFYAFTSTPLPASQPSKNLSLISEHVALILREIDASERRLHQIQRELSGYNSLDPLNPSFPSDLRLFLSRHPLPLGKDSKSGITQMISSVSHSCSRSTDLLSSFSSYKPWSKCPNDSLLVTKLIVRGCDPLPRRRCLTRPSTSLPAPTPIAHQIWLKLRGKNDFLIDDVLKMGKGAIRTGLDISGGVGDFAVRMAERNVTIVTTSSDSDSGAMMASRGVFPLLMSTAGRFPFYDSVFDLVHTTKGLDEGAVDKTKSEGMEFLMFDIDRVLRTGGLFWLDNYHCVDDERKRVVTRLIESFGYKKLKWVVGEKVDGAGRSRVYLSAVLQKPARG
ncbi:putative S-adenosyl-L-methionine-dependent methyltransferase protein [Dioscorea alata]|uniref:S-adenosyl-L-methionine-dependent methyltransferase protein n=2 Tax=Dioscorea alata TaxID=55571 RepID=A0ACB7V6J9_DIOAL|nr:putative S-adenosyl-L-methionine-dependent methyltransferase protein [Dioscorea alata]KAH7669063.1 putative S-adenosyl-L-methionine-dependent methyltransferase protein [Dioscorea alata]